MAEEELVISASGSPKETTESNKRKLENFELNNAAGPLTDSKPVSDPDSADNVADGEENGGADESDAKRPRLESNGDNVDEADAAVSQNGHPEEQKADEPEEEADRPEHVDNNSLSVEVQEPTKETLSEITEEPVSNKPEDSSVEDVTKTEAEVVIPSEDLCKEGDDPVSFTDPETGSDTQIISRKIEVPNDKVGVLIGKAGDTIRSLQDNSGAKIQIMRDADADTRAATRPLELLGTLQSINKAERLIKDVIAEADAGGSPSLVARGFNTVQSANGGEQVEIQVPFEKVGVIIGKGGESIRNLQARSGARIQLIQPSPDDGNRSGERTVRITGNKKQIENAREMIKDIMNQIVRQSPLSVGYNQQGHRPRGPISPQWGPRGPHPQFSGYNNYPQREPYPSQGSQYQSQTFGNYPPQQGQRGNFGPNWGPRPPTSMHGPSPQGNYNYGQQQGPDYGHSPYSQPPAQPYGHHGYNEVKYDHHASSQQPYAQQTPYGQGATHPGYGPHDQYSKPPMYIQPPPHSQPYPQPRPSQEVPFQAQMPPTQPYSQNPPPQPAYPHAPVQQNYPPYGPTATTAPPPQVGQGQPVVGYNQQQPGAAYPQQPAGGYSYPTGQYGYPEQQPAASAVAYGGYQMDPAYCAAQGQAPTYPAPAAGQAAYAQLGQSQPTYDQSAGYGNAPAPTSVSPLPAAYPQYDATGQMYGAPR